MPPTPSPEMTSLPQTIHPVTLSEREQKLWQDHEWVLHDADVQRTYAGSVIAVSNRTVLGSGKTHQAALEAARARADCPPREQILTIAVEGHPLSMPSREERKEP